MQTSWGCAGQSYAQFDLANTYVTYAKTAPLCVFSWLQPRSKLPQVGEDGLVDRWNLVKLRLTKPASCAVL